MSDPAAGTATGTNTGSGVTLDQVLAMVAALTSSVQTLSSQAGATQAMQTQIADGLKSLTENVNKLAVATDSDTGYIIRSAMNPADDQERMMKQRDEVGTVSLKLLTTMTENADAMMKSYLKYADGVWASSADHFRALPPIAPRAAAV